MANRRVLEVQAIGDVQSLIKSLNTADGATERFGRRTAEAGKNVEGVHVRIRRSFAGMAVSAAKAGVGIAAAYASIEGAKKAVDTTVELAHSTLQLHNALGLSVEAASRWGAVAQARGIDSKKLSQAFGTLSKNADTAGVAYDKQKAKMDALGNSTADLKKKAALATTGAGVQMQAFQRLGLSISDVKGANKNFEGFIEKVGQKFEALRGGTEKAHLGMQLFGRGWQTLLPLMVKGSQGMDAQLKLADKYGVTFHGKTVKSLEELVAAQRESKFATMGLQVAFGTFLAPALTKAIQGVSRFILGVRDGTGVGGRFRAVIDTIITSVKNVVGWLEKHKAVMLALGAVIGAVGAAIVTYNVAVATMTTVMKVVTVATKAWAAVQWLVNAALDANPIGIVVVAVAALAAGLVIAYEKSKTFRDIVNGAFSAVKTVVGSVIDFVKNNWKLLPLIFLGPIGVVAGIFVKFHTQILDTVKAVVSDVLGVLKALPGDMLTVGKNIVQGLIHGIESEAGNIISAIKSSITDLIPNFVKKALGINSPSLVFRRIGVGIGEGLILGIHAGKAGITSALQSGLLYPIDAAIAALQNRSAALQATWAKMDSAAQRAGLVAAIASAKRGAAMSAASSGGTGGALFGATRGGKSARPASISGGSVAQQIISVGRSMGASPKAMLAAIETGIVESGLKNLNYGDADSLGWRQERTSIYGRKHATSVVLSAQDFFREAAGASGSTAGELAANVQRPAAQYRGRYQQVQAQAAAILAGLLHSTSARVTSSGSSVRTSGSGTHGGGTSSVAAATKALKDFDVQATRAKKLAAIDMKIKGLEQLKAFKDGVAAIKTSLADMAQQAAAAWRTVREGQISAAHDAAVAAIGNSPDAQALAALQGQDAAAQDAQTVASNQKALTDAQYAVAHSGGQAKLDALDQLKQAQDAIDAYNRQKEEQRLQTNIDNATKAADDTQAVALSGLDKEEADYKTSLDNRLVALTDNLGKSKDSYAKFVSDVQAILGPLGLTFPTDSGTEATISTGPGGMGATGGGGKHTITVWGHKIYHRATGGSMNAGQSYMVGELGPERFTPGVSGHLSQASQSRGGSGATVIMEKVYMQGTRAAQQHADRLAYRLRFG